MNVVEMWQWIIAYQVVIVAIVAFLDYIAFKKDVSVRYFKRFWRTYAMIFLFVVDCAAYGFFKGVLGG